MIKKTLYFGNPAYLSLRMEQMVIKLPEVENSDNLPEAFISQSEVTRPIEDIGIVILDNKRITITQGLLESLLDNNCAVITCDSRRMPVGLMLPLCGNTIQSERFRQQISASLPLRKQLWQQTIKAKITNQAKVLAVCSLAETRCMSKWSEDVKSGDSENIEARAAAYYWKKLFSGIKGLETFTRNRDGIEPNNLLNYGYAILRAVVARALVSSGMLPTFGIHHHNRYNAYCLADDIMEPYRPFIDKIVCDIPSEIRRAGVTQENKVKMLNIPTMEVNINGHRSPLMNAVAQTVSSLVKCFDGESKRLIYPDF